MSAPSNTPVLVDKTPVQEHFSSDGHQHQHWLVKAMLALIHGYQLARFGRPTGCRYMPSCSEYATEAINGHGAVRGGALALRRLARCNPLGGHGIDPVPDRRAQ